MVDERLHRGDQAVHVVAWWNHEQHRLADAVEHGRAVGEPAHDRRQRHLADGVTGQHGSGGGDGCRGRQRGRGLVQEHVPRVDRHPGPPGAAHQVDRDDAVAAQGEEVVVNAHGVAVQDGGEQLAQHAFGVGGGRAGDRRRDLGLGQRGAVELAVRGERQRVEGHDRRRKQVLGQRAGQVVEHPVDTVPDGHRVRHELSLIHIV